MRGKIEREGAPVAFRVELLGPFAVYRDGEELDTSSWQRSALTLLKMLATSRTLRRQRDELMDVLWPDASPGTGGSNLRYVLTVLRRNLGGGEPSPVISERGWVALNPAYAWEVDLGRFERLLQGEPASGTELEAALALYRGEPLQEDRYEDWASPIREHVGRRWRNAGMQLARVARERGAADTALICLERVLEADSLDEEALQELLRTLTDMGRRTEALRRYQQFEERLRAELDLSPSPETTTLIAAVREGKASPTPAGHLQAAAIGERRPQESTQTFAFQALRPGAFLGSLPMGILVGREEELGCILRQADRAERGEGQLILLAGEPGVGKTRVAQEVTRSVLERGFVVAAGRCYETEQGAPYYPFLDVLADVYRAAPPAFQHEVAARWPYLGWLLPEVLSFPLNEGNPGDVQPLLFRAVTSFLLAAAEIRPVALLLDDLHWADAASLRLLLHLARHLSASRVLLLGTYRNLEVGRQHPLEQALLDLQRERLVERLAIRRFEPGDTAALVAATLDEANVPARLADLVHQTTAGNAYFVQQVVQSLVDRGDIYRQNGGWHSRESGEIVVPDSVRAVIGQRLSRMPAATQEILQAASVLGQTFLLEALVGMIERSEDEIETALEAAARAGLLRIRGTDDYAFDHALTWQTLLAELPSRKRRKLHRAAEEILAGLPGTDQRPADIARHFLEAGETGGALVWSLRAGDGAEALYAHDEAEQHYRVALELAREGMGGTPDRRGEAEALTKLGEVLIVVSRHGEALPMEEQAAATFRSLGDLEGEGRAVTRIMWAHGFWGATEELVERARPVIEALEAAGPSRILVDLYATFRFQLWIMGRLDEAVKVDDRISELARQTCYERYIADARVRRGSALITLGQIDEGLRQIETGLPAVESVGDLFALCTNLRLVAEVSMQRGEIEKARVFVERAVVAERARGDPYGVQDALGGQGWLAFLKGDWQRAKEWFQAGIESLGDWPTSPRKTVCQAGLCLLEILSGQDDGAMSYFRESEEPEFFTVYAYLVLVEHHLEQEGTDAVRRRLEAIPKSTLQYDRLLGDVAWAQVHLATGKSGQAQKMLTEAKSMARALRLPLVLIEVLIVEGELLGWESEWEEATRSLEEALGLSREIGLPYHEAQVLRMYGEVLARAGEREAARERLEAAQAIFERLGAGLYVGHVEGALSSLGS